MGEKRDKFSIFLFSLVLPATPLNVIQSIKIICSSLKVVFHNTFTALFPLLTLRIPFATVAFVFLCRERAHRQLFPINLTGTQHLGCSLPHQMRSWSKAIVTRLLSLLSPAPSEPATPKRSPLSSLPSVKSLPLDSYRFILVKTNCVIAWALDLNNSDCCFVGKSFLLFLHKILP